MKRYRGDTASSNGDGGYISARSVNLWAVGWYVVLTAFEYLFCRLVIEPYIGCVWSHVVFGIVFMPLTVCFLWAKHVTPAFESWGNAVWLFLKNHPALWFGIRAVVDVSVLAVAFYLLWPMLKWPGDVDWSYFKPLALWLLFIDGLIVFLAFYGKKQTRDALNLGLEKAYRDIDGIVRKDVIEEVFYLTTMVSVILKAIVVVVIAAGVVGAAGIWTSIFTIILPYFVLSVIETALFITGSIGATVRYWQWLLTEPPKIVIRFLFKIKRDQTRCYHCERIIPLVGIYECPSCHFKFKGHYFNWCPNCYSRFSYIDCECGLSRKRPVMY